PRADHRGRRCRLPGVVVIDSNRPTRECGWAGCRLLQSRCEGSATTGVVPALLALRASAMNSLVIIAESTATPPRLIRTSPRRIGPTRRIVRPSVRASPRCQSLTRPRPTNDTSHESIVAPSGTSSLSMPWSMSRWISMSPSGIWCERRSSVAAPCRILISNARSVVQCPSFLTSSSWTIRRVGLVVVVISVPPCVVPAISGGLCFVSTGRISRTTEILAKARYFVYRNTGPDRICDHDGDPAPQFVDHLVQPHRGGAARARRVGRSVPHVVAGEWPDDAGSAGRQEQSQDRYGDRRP